MCNLENIKKIYKFKGDVRKSLIFKECKKFILNKLANKYNYPEIIDLLKIKLNDNGLEELSKNLNDKNLFYWVKKHLKEELENLNRFKNLETKTEEAKEVGKKSIFKNLVE